MSDHCHACILCGLPVDEDLSDYIPNWQAEAWMLSDRLIFFVQGHWDEAYMSDPREMLSPIGIDVPDFSKPIWVQTGPDRRNFGMEWWNYEETLCGFGIEIHCACWEVLNSFRPNEQLDFTTLMRACLSFPVDNSKIQFGLDYQGRINYRMHSDVPGDEFNSLTFSERIGLRHEPDPSHLEFLYDLDEYFWYPNWRHHSDDALNEYAPISKVLPKAKAKDIFNSLPPELLSEVMNLLSCKDVGNLRKASRAAAVVGLSESFWKSRFFAGGEFEYLYEAHYLLDVPAEQNKWKDLYMWVTRFRHSDAVRQRRRFWELSSQFYRLIDMVTESPCHGTAASGVFDISGYEDELVWHTASSFYGSPEALFERFLTLPETVDSIYVSTIRWQGRELITGLRFISGDASYEIGYVRQNSEKPVHIPKADQTGESAPIKGFHLTQTSWGIRGIAVMTDSGVTEWVGDQYEHIPRRKLTFPPRDDNDMTFAPRDDNDRDDIVKHIKCGFDGIKMVSLSVSGGSKPTRPDPDSASTRRKDRVPLKNIRDEGLWFPPLPPDHLNFAMGTQFVDKTISNSPATWSAFGGLNGENLEDITGLRAWVHYNPDFGHHQICRLAVETSHGSAWDIGDDLPESGEYYFAIDGQKGERITGLSTYYDPVEQADERDGKSFLGFSVHTNFKRSQMFPNEIANTTGSFRQMIPDHGGLVVGFCAAWVGGDLCDSRFTEIGIVYIPEHPDGYWLRE